MLDLDYLSARKLVKNRGTAEFLVRASELSQTKTAKKQKGWFHKSLSQWAELGISRYIVTSSTSILVSKGLLETTREVDYQNREILGGSRTWYKINLPKLKALLKEAKKQSLK